MGHDGGLSTLTVDAADRSWLVGTVDDLFPDHPLVADVEDHLDYQDPVSSEMFRSTTATLSTGRTVQSPEEISTQEITDHLGAVAGLEPGRVSVRQHEAGWRLILSGTPEQVQGWSDQLSNIHTHPANAVAHHITEGAPSLVRAATLADQKVVQSPGVGDAGATFEAGGAAVADALARLQAGRPSSNHRDDHARHTHGGPSIR